MVMNKDFSHTFGLRRFRLYYHVARGGAW
eukprot:COSAG01_NODE_26550_length_710_cov_1.797054_1_plen_28_part_10